jgi:hypothetical protein
MTTQIDPKNETQVHDTTRLKKFKKFPENPPKSARRRPLWPYTDYEKTFSKQEVIFLCSIVNSSHISNGRIRKIYWCTRAELIEQFGDDLYKQLQSRQAIEEWQYHDDYPIVTLTPWCAKVLGFRLVEYWVRHIEKVEEYRGLNRRPKRIRIQRWDTEACWTYCDRPERSIRIPGNTCELPLIGDPEDKRYQENRFEYLEDWHTWSFTKNPKKALGITIRVGGFAHKIMIQRNHKKKS